MAGRTPTWNDARKTFLLANVPGSTTYWTLNDLEYAYANGAFNIQALDSVTTVWLYGASIENGVCKVGDLVDYTPALTCYLSQKVGRAITVVNKGVPSQTMDQILVRFNADDKAAATALGDQLLILTMPMGNDITTSRPFPGGMPGFQDDYVALMSSFLESGAYVMPSTATFRDYGGTTVNDEGEGSLPYNTGVIAPYVMAMSPVMRTEGGEVYNDPYNFPRNWYSIVLDDEVHFTNEGYRILGKYWMDVAAARILGQASPPAIPRVADPTASQVKPATDVAFRCNSGGNHEVSPNILGFMSRGVFNNAADQMMIPAYTEDGYAPTNITITNYQVATGSASNGTNLNTGDTSNSLLNDLVKSTTIPVESDAWFLFATFKGLAAAQPFEVDILSARYVVAGDATRITQFSLDNSTVAGEVASAYMAGQVPTILTISGSANGSGEVTLYLRRKAGSSFGYINGALLRPL